MTFSLRKLFEWTAVIAVAFYLGFHSPLSPGNLPGRFSIALGIIVVYFVGFWYLRTIHGLWPRNQKELIKEVVARCRQERSKDRS